MALIRTKELSVNHRLKSISFDLAEGEILGLIGPNGSGKSTLLNAIAGLEESDGEIQIQDKEYEAYSAKQRAQLIGLQPQTVSSAWSLTVIDIVALGRIPWGDHDEAIIHQAMQRAEVSELADRTIDTLSGGESARVWLARVFAGQPKILLADEPIASLDIHYQLAVMNVLANYATEGHGVIVAMHDLSLAARFCGRLCFLDHGELVALGTPKEVLTESLLTKAYGIAVDIDLDRDPPIVLPR